MRKENRDTSPSGTIEPSAEEQARFLRDSEADRATTDRTVELLEDIRNMCADAIEFIPGHVMKLEYRLRCEARLKGIIGALEQLGLRDFAMEKRRTVKLCRR